MIPKSSFVEKIFLALSGGTDMQSVQQVEAIENSGLRGDRYAEGTGYWVPVDTCQVTLIEGEDLERIQSTTSVKVLNGEHRRNLVTRGVRLDELLGRRFRVGEAIFEYDRPRPPCRYIASITEQGMTGALTGRAGICARVVQSGIIRCDDSITIVGTDADL